jgi:hypothetical protein
MEMWANDYLIKADTTPKDALAKVESHLRDKEDNSAIYINPGLNNFKIKNPNGGEDIDVEINIKL